MTNIKMPCEIIIWYVLPAIRKGIADSMIKDYNLNQAEVARKLGITDTAVSQYLSEKRARVVIDDSKILE